MKNKKLDFLIIGILILFSLNTFAETKKLKQIGRYKFVNLKDDISAEEVMKTIVERYTEDIKYGLDIAGHSDLYLPFIDKIKQSAFEEKKLAIGDKMVWMLFRSQGKVKIVHDLEWAGKEPLPVFSFTVVKADNNYEFIMPKSCGNISLLKVEKVIPGAISDRKPSQAQQEQEQEQEQQYQIRKAKIYQQIYALLDEVDLYCSLSIWEDKLPKMKIVGAERENERAMFSDGDVVYLNKGKDDGLEPGQLFLILKIEQNLPGYGRLALKKGRARILSLAANQSIAVLENCCGATRIGNYLVPFEPREGIMGKYLGYDVSPLEANGVKGEVIYLETDFNQIASGHWALINIGAEDGIQVGQQLVLYKRILRDAQLRIYGNTVVIDVQSVTATIKVLSCRDVISIGDMIMVRPTQ